MPETTRARWRWPAMLLAGLASLMVLMQLAPFDWAGTCIPGTSLCGSPLCTVSGEWHLAWDIPYNGLFAPVQNALGITFGLPPYFIAVFVLPLCYGAWKFTLFHALVGPIAADMLTGNPNEVPAIWCLFSIGIIVVALSPRMWHLFERREAVA